jgi:hypothetical protein
MDLVCPSCQKRLTIEDRYAGMVVKCPLCGSMLQAPVLLTTPPMPTLASPLGASASQPTTTTTPFDAAVPTMPALELPPSSTPTPAPPHQAPGTMPEIFVAPPVTVEPPVPVTDHPEILADLSEVPTVRQGEYTTKIRFHLRPEVLSWITPSCLVLLFFLSFFTWYHSETFGTRNLWQLGFSEGGYARYVFYIVFTFIALMFAVLVLSFEQQWIPLPVGLRPFWPWRALIVGAATALPFIFFLGDYVACHFQVFGNPTSIAMKLAFRVHLLAVVASALHFWLEQRKGKNAPLPRLELRW